jgi:hypothetical protein
MMAAMMIAEVPAIAVAAARAMEGIGEIRTSRFESIQECYIDRSGPHR